MQGPGCNKKGAPVRKDLPLHDMTGGNYWVADLIKYQDVRGQLRLGGDLTSVQSLALDAGVVRAKKQLSEAASLEVIGNTVRIVNQTGHKLITGYPEGRRMWLNIRWYDGDSILLREDGAWGPVAEVVNPADGQLVQVESLLDLDDPHTKVYEAHYAMTRDWAAALLSLGYPTDLALSYDRFTGLVDYTLGDLANQIPGTHHETFHFVLNNYVAKDNRIPPYGFSYDEARKRNALPVPEGQFGSPGPGGTYDYWDELVLNPPAGAIYAEIDLVYQGTSWEYVQFLWLANTGASAFLADEGVNMLEAWINTGMVQPYVMASTVWGDAPVPPTPAMYSDSITTWTGDQAGRPGDAEISTAGEGGRAPPLIVRRGDAKWADREARSAGDAADSCRGRVGTKVRSCGEPGLATMRRVQPAGWRERRPPFSYPSGVPLPSHGPLHMHGSSISRVRRARVPAPSGTAGCSAPTRSSSRSRRRRWPGCPG